jgi:lipid II:glycine glycyltransferase (peptidoglycan interpeptide bridge formation enzyme)
MEVDNWITGRRGVSLPFTDECIPLASTPEHARELLFKAIQLGRTAGWRRFVSQGAGHLIPEVAAGQPLYFSHSLDLRKTPDQLFDLFSDANRRAIRKAERSHVVVEEATDCRALALYYELHCLSRKRFGLPPQPWSLFKQIHQHVLARGLGFILLARHEGRAIAGAVFCHSGSHAVFKFGASDLAYQAVRPNNLILWEAIQRLISKGAEKFSLGRTSLANEGLRRFKLSWGSTENKSW